MGLQRAGHDRVTNTFNSEYQNKNVPIQEIYTYSKTKWSKHFALYADELWSLQNHYNLSCGTDEAIYKYMHAHC